LGECTTPIDFDSIKNIKACRFKGVYNGDDFMMFLTNPELSRTSGIEHVSVDINNIRPPGVHLYKIEMNDGSTTTCLIWMLYTSSFLHSM
jgi:hypothetical protein